MRLSLIMAAFIAAHPAMADPMPNACVAIQGLMTFAGHDDPLAAAAVEAGEAQACRTYLEGINMAAGLDDPACAGLLYTIEMRGVPQAVMREAGQVYRHALMADDPAECAEAHSELLKMY